MASGQLQPLNERMSVTTLPSRADGRLLTANGPGADNPALLPEGSVVFDGVPGSMTTPPGHVSVFIADRNVIVGAIVEKIRNFESTGGNP